MRSIPEPVRALLRPNAGWYALAAAIGLMTLGLAAIGTVAGVGQVPEDVVGKQGYFWVPLAAVMCLLCLIPHPRVLGHMSYVLFGFTLVLLMYLIIPGVPLVQPINGARSWIDLPGGARFQPVEMAKVAFVMSLAWYLRYRSSYRTLKGLLVPFALMFVPVGLILKQPDLGSALLFAPTLFILLIAAGAKLRHLLALLGIGVVAVALNVAVIAIDPPHEYEYTNRHKVPAALHVLKGHQERRIAALLYPEHYANDAAFQQIVAKRIAGAGGITGQGREQTRLLVRYNGLPEPHNDMIFSVIVCRWGLVGALATIGLYVVLVSSMLLVAARSKDPFARLCCVGFGGMIFTQATINIGVCIGLLPVTGITLPMISYGGSSLLFTFAMVGMTINFASRRPKPLARPSFEFDHADAIFQ